MIFGLSDGDFQKIGLKDPGKIQQDLASMCADMDPVIRPVIEIHRLDGKSFVTAEIAELPRSAKPCYYRPAGMVNGAFISGRRGRPKAEPVRSAHNAFGAGAADR
jgi:ATP-dependent DNA helicase RecG